MGGREVAMSGVRGQARAADAPAQLLFSRFAGRTPSAGAIFSALKLYIDGHLCIQLASLIPSSTTP